MFYSGRTGDKTRRRRGTNPPPLGTRSSDSGGRHVGWQARSLHGLLRPLPQVPILLSDALVHALVFEERVGILEGRLALVAPVLCGLLLVQVKHPKRTSGRLSELSLKVGARGYSGSLQNNATRRLKSCLRISGGDDLRLTRGLVPPASCVPAPQRIARASSRRSLSRSPELILEDQAGPQVLDVHHHDKHRIPEEPSPGVRVG